MQWNTKLWCQLENTLASMGWTDESEHMIIIELSDHVLGCHCKI